LHGFGGSIQPKPVGNEAADVQLAGEYQPGDFRLDGEISGITPQQVFFVHTDGGEVQLGEGAAFGMGEEEDLAGAADGGEGLLEGGVGGDG
jgi:hypothetical protein